MGLTDHNRATPEKAAEVGREPLSVVFFFFLFLYGEIWFDWNSQSTAASSEYVFDLLLFQTMQSCWGLAFSWPLALATMVICGQTKTE